MERIKPTKFELAQPIDRIRGTNEITIALNVFYSVNGREISVPGVSIVKDLTEDQINDGIQRAVSNSYKYIDTLEVLSNGRLIKLLLQEKIDELTKQKKKEIQEKSPENCEELFEKFNMPPDELRIKELAKICHELSVPVIDVSSGWTMIEVVALNKELKALYISLTN